MDGIFPERVLDDLSIAVAMEPGDQQAWYLLGRAMELGNELAQKVFDELCGGGTISEGD